MTFNKVEIVSDENGTKVKLNDGDELKGISDVAFHARTDGPAELTLRFDVLPEMKRCVYKYFDNTEEVQGWSGSGL